MLYIDIIASIICVCLLFDTCLKKFGEQWEIDEHEVFDTPLQRKPHSWCQNAKFLEAVEYCLGIITWLIILIKN